jgi:hypothetical protein
MTPSNLDRIAVCVELFPRSLKQRLLFFDSICVFDVEETVELLRVLATSKRTFLRRAAGIMGASGITASEADDNSANDLEFLASKNIVFNAPK